MKEVEEAMVGEALQSQMCTIAAPDMESSSSARLWMSEEAMVSARITTGSLVAVSLRESDSDGLLEPASDPAKVGSKVLASLINISSSYFNVDVPTKLKHNTAGGVFAVAEVWPSRKLVRSGVRLSKHLATSLGNPRQGSAIFLNPISVGQTVTKGDTGIPRLKAEVSECSNLALQWCPPLENITLPPSPLPPPSPVFKTPTSSNKRKPRTGAGASPFQEKDQFRNSPSPSPVSKMDSRRLESSPGFSNQEEPRFAIQNVGNIAAVRTFFEGDGSKGMSLVQLFAERWLCGRYLMPGSLVSLPMCGCDCLFVVSHNETLSGVKTHEDSDVEGVLPSSLPIYKVTHKTKIKLVGPPGAKTSSQAEEQQAQSLDVVENENPTGKIKEEVKYTSLGGLERQIAEIKQIVRFSLLRPELLAGYGLTPHRGILLYGPPGTGKSTLARAAACEAGVPLFGINGPDVVSQFYGESEEALRAVFTAAEEAAPSVVVIDEVDAIAPERKDGSEELSQRMVGALLKLMDEGGNKRVLVIAATNRPDTLDPALRRPGRFDKEVEIGVPTSEGRHEILKYHLCNMRHSLREGEILELAASTHGFVGADLSSLCHEAALAALRRCIQLKPDLSASLSTLVLPTKSQFNSSMVTSPHDDENNEVSPKKTNPSNTGICSLCTALESVQLDPAVSQGPEELDKIKEAALTVNSDDFEVAKTRVRPSAMREVMLEIPKVRWSDIGGMEDVKQHLQEAVIWPQKHGDRLISIGAQPIRGVLLYGPPGCSKTLLARACASEAGLNFIAVKGPELFSKWVGESEKAVQSLFARARAAAPSIVFFDEIDALAVARSSGDTGGLSVGDRVMSQLLTEMDGLKPSTGVSVIAATNRPDIIDPALLRPGRFDRQLYVGPPDEVSREKIFKIQLRNTPYSPLVKLETLAARTPSYTGADISAVCRVAAMSALEEDLNAVQVEVRHFERALAEVAPSNPGPSPEFFTKFNRGLFSGDSKGA
ncbi:hypothetical protein M758_UG075600 [Ceratodon purpureus]|nr:hypothetical protein M758_UG075600 [Ceratodon purpureus]